MLSLRQHKISRLEEFSDAVFGFALTLLVVGSVVPRGYPSVASVPSVSSESVTSVSSVKSV